MQVALKMIPLALLLAGESIAQNIAEPPFALRALYAPGHFGNSYEVVGEREMRDLLAEAKHWGFNRYADWFDMDHCRDPFADRHYELGGALWDRKKAHFRSAQALGLACDLTITPNHVYLNQVRPDLAAEQGGRIFGQLLCPSKPEARDIILRNYENLFADLAKAGVHLDALWLAPYDFGGCACEACQPWILTFAKLSRDIHAIGTKYHPGLEMRFIGWWWSEEEHRLFADWADKEVPGVVKSIALHIPYGQTDVSDVPLPPGCERQAFVHIGYAEQAQPRDLYGHLGPVIAADRLAKTLAALKAHGCTGVMAYSEGVYEDVNKALLAGMVSGAFSEPDAVLRAYADRYFAADAQTAPLWSDWLTAWGRPYDVDASAALKQLDALCFPALRSDWRVRQWELKCRLLQHNAAIMAEQEWTPTRLEAVEAFWATQEELDRQVYGLGPLRHILGRRFSPMPWYKDWAKYVSEHPATQSGEE